MKVTNPRMTGWDLAFQPYTFIIKHRWGKHHANTDFFSCQMGQEFMDKRAHVEEGECYNPASEASYCSAALPPLLVSAPAGAGSSCPREKTTKEGWGHRPWDHQQVLHVIDLRGHTYDGGCPCPLAPCFPMVVQLVSMSVIGVEMDQAESGFGTL